MHYLSRGLGSRVCHPGLRRPSPEPRVVSWYCTPLAISRSRPAPPSASKRFLHSNTCSRACARSLHQGQGTEHIVACGDRNGQRNFGCPLKVACDSAIGAHIVVFLAGHYRAEIRQKRSSNSSPFARSPFFLLTRSVRITKPLVPSARVNPITTSVRLPISLVASGNPSANRVKGLCGLSCSPATHIAM